MNMFDAILKSKFYSKCKSEIKLTKRRIEIIKRKRNAMQKFLRNDVADLLKNGLDSNAYGRVEQLYTDQNLSSCYEFVEQSCLLILSNLSAMEKQRECPQECKEAISTLMFAAARFADLPELRELRSLFADRYGNFLEPYVNQEFMQKLKAETPIKEIKLEMMQEIAMESGIEWDYKALEKKLYKPPPFVKEWAECGNKKQDLERNVKVKEEVGNGLAYKSRAEVVEKKEKPYWSSNSSCSSESTTSPEYSTDSASEDGPAEGRKSYTLRSMGPPYIKKEATTSWDNIQTASEGERKSYGLRSMAPPYMKTDNLKHEDKAVPRSMRVRRPLKPVAASHAHNEISKDENRGDEEEKKSDKSSNGPTRVTSLPTQVLVTEEENKGFTRAATIQGDSGGHVHPKLPDYDDFVARLAAFRATNS